MFIKFQNSKINKKKIKKKLKKFNISKILKNFKISKIQKIQNFHKIFCLNTYSVTNCDVRKRMSELSVLCGHECMTYFW